MKSLFEKTDNSTDNFQKSWFFLCCHIFIVLLCWLAVFLVIYYLIKIAQLQFDWD